MSNGEKIVAAIDRCTAAIEQQTAWLKETEDPMLPVLEELRLFAKAIFLVLCLLLGTIIAKATPILPPLSYEIGQPPSPPPNHNMQYWYTMDVPGPDGVLPVEVFAPRLVAQVASETQVVETPEPGTGWAIGGLLMLLVSFAVVNHIARKALDAWGLWAKQAASYRDALNEIYWNSGDDVAKQLARKALEGEGKEPKR